MPKTIEKILIELTGKNNFAKNHDFPTMKKMRAAKEILKDYGLEV